LYFKTLDDTERMNTMFEMCVRLSVTAPMWILAFRIQIILFGWKYDQHMNFHRKMSSELVRNIHFFLVLTLLIKANNRL